MLIEHTDEELMHRVKETRDRGSFGLLMQRHWFRAKKIASYFIRESYLAEDIAQESFLRILQYRKSYRNEMNFSPWLSSVVRRVSLDHLAKNQKNQKHLNQFQQERHHSFYQKEELFYSRPAGLELLHSLSKSEEKILRLRMVDELSFKEISQIMACSEEAAKKKAQRALKKLRKKISVPSLPVKR